MGGNASTASMCQSGGIERKAGFRSLGDTWADYTNAHGRLVLTVLAGFERELIRAWTEEGTMQDRGRRAGRHCSELVVVIGRPKAGMTTAEGAWFKSRRTSKQKIPLSSWRYWIPVLPGSGTF
jgi:hypothetical protein